MTAQPKHARARTGTGAEVPDGKDAIQRRSDPDHRLPAGNPKASSMRGRNIALVKNI
jgi:hypothetical protein